MEIIERAAPLIRPRRVLQVYIPACLQEELSAFPVHRSCHERTSSEHRAGNIHSYCETYNK